MDKISSRYKISSKLNGKIKKKGNMQDPDKYQMFQENNIAEIKHVVESERTDAPSQNSVQLSKTVFASISNIRLNVNCKTDHKSHNLTKKASKNIPENYERFYSKHNKYAKTRSRTFYSVSSVYSSETKKSSIKLFYCNKKKEVNKAIFYRDICITGEKIALWRRLKNKISSLASSVSDGKFNMDNFSKQKSQINKKYKESDIWSAKKTKFKPFLQRFWNFYCKCDEANNTKCNKVPVIQFPDIPEHCLYKTCSCLKQTSDQCIFKSRYSCNMKSSNHIMKSSRTEIGISCREPNIVATREVCCDTNRARFDTYTDMSEHLLLQNNSTQYIEQEIEMKSHEQIIVEKRCASTQDDIQDECGDQNRETDEINKLNIKSCLQNCLSTQLKHNGNNICDKGRSLIKKLNRMYTDSLKCNPQKKYCTRKTQTCLNKRKAMKSGTDGKKILFRNLEKSTGVQCVTNNAKCQTLGKYQRTKKVAVKTIVRNKSCTYKLPSPGLSTKKTQCVQQPPFCNLQKHSNLVALCKKLSYSKMKKPTCKLQPKRRKCNKKYALIKSCEKCTSSKKTHKMSVQTQCPVMVPIDGNNSYKQKFCKHRLSKISDHTMVALKKFKNSKENTLYQKSCSRKLICKKYCNSIGIQCCPPEPTICTCTKDLYYSKSCNNILSRKRPTCSIGTQENQRNILQNLHKMKNNWSLFNLKKCKTLEPCRCIQSLMFIDKAYRNYHINPAMVSQIKRCQNKCLFCNQDCKHLIYSKMRRALIAELKKRYVNRSIQCKVKPCANCKWEHKVCGISPCSKYCPVSTCRHCCSAYCNPCYTLPNTLPCRSILSKYARKCKKRAKQCDKGLSSKTHHCQTSSIHRIRCRVKKFFRLSNKESCGCRRKCGRKSKVLDDPNKIFLKTVRKPRYTRIYRQCPWAYPECLKCLDIWKQNIQIIFVIIAWILWCPCIILMELFRVCCCYFCYK